MTNEDKSWHKTLVFLVMSNLVPSDDGVAVVSWVGHDSWNDDSSEEDCPKRWVWKNETSTAPSPVLPLTFLPGGPLFWQRERGFGTDLKTM